MKATRTIAVMLLVLGIVSGCGESRATSEEIGAYWDRIEEYTEDMRAVDARLYLLAAENSFPLSIHAAVSAELTDMLFTSSRMEELMCPQGYELEGFHRAFRSATRDYAEAAQYISEWRSNQDAAMLAKAEKSAKSGAAQLARSEAMRTVWAEEYAKEEEDKMDESVYLWLGLVIALIVGLIIGNDASSRGMNGFLWGLFVFLVCIVALPIYVIVRKPRLQDR